MGQVAPREELYGELDMCPEVIIRDGNNITGLSILFKGSGNAMIYFY